VAASYKHAHAENKTDLAKILERLFLKQCSIKKSDFKKMFPFDPDFFFNKFSIMCSGNLLMFWYTLSSENRKILESFLKEDQNTNY
jgi:hypothetical protein